LPCGPHLNVDDMDYITQSFKTILEKKDLAA
jgi:hypothetical protein